MSDLDELAEAARGGYAPSASVRIGSVWLPCEAVEAIEPCSGHRMRPIGYLGLVCIGLGLFVFVAGMNGPERQRWFPDYANRDVALAALFGLGGAGVAWMMILQRRYYGWTVHCFHRPGLTVTFDSPRDAERMLAYLRANLPHVPVQRPQEVFFWWIRF